MGIKTFSFEKAHLKSRLQKFGHFPSPQYVKGQLHLFQMSQDHLPSGYDGFAAMWTNDDIKYGEDILKFSGRYGRTRRSVKF